MTRQADLEVVRTTLNKVEDVFGFKEKRDKEQKQVEKQMAKQIEKEKKEAVEKMEIALAKREQTIQELKMKLGSSEQLRKELGRASEELRKKLEKDAEELRKELSRKRVRTSDDNDYEPADEADEPADAAPLCADVPPVGGRRTSARLAKGGATADMQQTESCTEHHQVATVNHHQERQAEFQSEELRLKLGLPLLPNEGYVPIEFHDGLKSAIGIGVSKVFADESGKLRPFTGKVADVACGDELPYIFKIVYDEDGDEEFMTVNELLETAVASAKNDGLKDLREKRLRFYNK